ncbi:Uncharacterized protein BP5553_06251 [Venustampulla echinocandica]|uniref:PinX1-related protein 1 n=1 Tax=Venustampulla echinocandica TaxID=2656787 RepID=A0A370TN02_9HELO|nr:Uncharacterized protein BP5553_06251 [Venustampulla echinocandica]RDL36899.1 Uncharacterized protein BP5553_06251 [Venustampulla echinocandica]
MGLAGTKKRIKLSHDPNNTTWTNDTEGFGHKIMTAQGWQPGQYLGAKDAAHAEFHTAANASHIRVMIKDDNLGLGAKIGSGVGHGECTGLDVFKSILGRLNGKEEVELEQEKKSREDLKRAIYTERKWGSIRFVQGGFLIGDKIQHLIDGEVERVRKLAEGSTEDTSGSSSESELEERSEPIKKSKKSKKRKAEAIEEEVSDAVAVKVKKSKKKEKLQANEAEDAMEPLVEAKLSKKSKKDRKAKEEPDNTSDEDSKRKQRKKEKKEARKQKGKSTSEDQEEVKGIKKSKRDRKAALGSLPTSSESSQVPTKESTPSSTVPTPSSGYSTPMMQGRHAVRSRNIAQKRLASMDVASLNQIFMIKS